MFRYLINYCFNAYNFKNSNQKCIQKHIDLLDRCQLTNNKNVLKLNLLKTVFKKDVKFFNVRNVKYTHKQNYILEKRGF